MRAGAEISPGMAIGPLQKARSKFLWLRYSPDWKQGGPMEALEVDSTSTYRCIRRA